MDLPIKIERTNKVLSANGGLLMLSRLFKRAVAPRIADSLPMLKSGSAKSLHKFRDMSLGLAAGADCLDDMDRAACDEGFKALCGEKVYTAKAYGDFLRSFDRPMIKSLNQRLADLAHELRDSLFPESKSVTFDFDSTSNKQHGKKMEGVCMNYKGFESLDTIQAFDEHGLQYWNDVRPGSTFTSNGIAEIVHEVFHRMPRRLRRYGRADSGFCNSGFFNACFAKSVGFVCYMRDNMSGPLIGNVTDWKAQNPKRQSRVTFYDGRECEYGETLYALEGCPHVLRVVFIRAPKTGTSPTMFRHESDYDYHAWVTNIGEHEMNFERLIFFYRKRGNAENHVKELKYGLDLKHYPCLKLNANRAYGLIAAYTYNLMRFLSLKSNPRHPQLAKAIRFRFFHLPVQVVRHAREVTFRFMDHHYEEVRRWLLIIKNLQLGNA